MSDHFYVSEHKDLLDKGRAVLTGAEAQHIARVLRMKPGEELLLFDGSGREFVSVIDEVRKNQVDCSIREVRFTDKEPEVELTMAVALPKGERQKWLIEKLTELGVRRYIPVRCERADVKFDDDVLDRLRRQVIEASKQSGRLRLMEILPEMSRREIAVKFPFDGGDSTDGSVGVSVSAGASVPVGASASGSADDLTKESLSGSADDLVKIMTHPISDGFFGQKSFPELIHELNMRGTKPRRVLVVVGPVGGWTDAEVQEAVDDGWPTLDLGKQVYRVETAAIVAAALFLHL